MYRIVILLVQDTYISESGIVYDSYVNVTDDSIVEHVAPNAINAPIAGAGALTVIEGTLSLENIPANKLQSVGSDEVNPGSVWLSFTSSVSESFFRFDIEPYDVYFVEGVLVHN